MDNDARIKEKLYETRYQKFFFLCPAQTNSETQIKFKKSNG